MNVLVGPGDHVIATWPGYQSLYEVARATGAEITLHGLHESDGWAVDIERLRSEVRPNTRVIVVNTPHNPTGMMLDRTTYDGLLEIAEEGGIRLFMDEVYRGLEFDETDRLAAGADALPTGISLGVMSKAYALAGLRIGWIATHDRDLLARAGGVQGLHDDLLVGAVGDPGDHRVACPRPRPRALAGDHRREPRARGRVLRGLPRPVHLDPPERRVGRFPAADRARRVDRRLGGRPGQGRGRPAGAGSIFGYAGNHFRLGFGRTDLPKALAQTRGVRGEDPPMTIPARLGIVTLGVADLARSIAFYEALGWERCSSSSEAIAWFRTADTHIGLFPWDELAEDADLPPGRRPGFGGITLAINVEAADDVAPALAAVVAAGGTLLKPATLTDWGGTSGYVADPDGHPWEIAHNPDFAIGEDGRLHIP